MATMKLGNPVVDLVQNLTADAMDNIWDAEIEFPSSIAETNGLTAQARYRCKGITPPTPEAETYDVEYKGHKIKRVGSGIKLDHNFDLTFTIDAGYNLYTAFKAWNAISISANNGGSTVGNVLLAGGKIKLHAAVGTVAAVTDWGADAKEVEALEWIYDNVIVTKVEEPKFVKGQKGKVMEYKVSFIFGKYSYPTMPKANAMA